VKWLDVMYIGLTHPASRMWSEAMGFAAHRSCDFAPLLEAGPCVLELFGLCISDNVDSLKHAHWALDTPHVPLNMKKLKFCILLCGD